MGKRRRQFGPSTTERRALKNVAREPYSDILPIEVAVDQLPKRLTRGDRVFRIDYRPVLEGGRVNRVLVTLTDITSVVAVERAEATQRETRVRVASQFTLAVWPMTFAGRMRADTRDGLARPRRRALALTTAASLATLLVVYSSLRAYDVLYRTEPDPATVLWATRVAMFWRVATGGFVALATAPSLALLTFRNPSAAVRYVAAYVAFASVFLVLQGTLLP